jgi:hypothetical protein
MAKQPVCPPGGGSKTAGCYFGRLTPNECWWEKWCLGVIMACIEKEKTASRNECMG